jgi:hypothetical protein
MLLDVRSAICSQRAQRDQKKCAKGSKEMRRGSENLALFDAHNRNLGELNLAKVLDA